MKKSYFIKYFLFFFLLFSVGIFVCLSLVSCYFVRYGELTHIISTETIVEIPYGSSPKKVSSLLQESGIIEDKDIFYLYLRLARKDSRNIQAGYYILSGEQTNAQLATNLLFGREQAVRVTFKEGQNMADFAKTLEDAGLFNQDDFKKALINPEILTKINPPQNLVDYFFQHGVGGIEGYLFPDTYFFTKRDTPEKIILKMHQKLINKITESLQAKMTEQNLSLHELLTIASIVEKETGQGYERPLVANVYLNRIKQGMLLQADPTVIYGMKNYQGKIGKKDLQAFHEYNTYTQKGLPLGPICSVGIESIKAVLWPAETKYLFFVSKNDGSHEFCENLKCHNQAVKKWQIDFFRKKKH